jgi:hypothetical protein
MKKVLLHKSFGLDPLLGRVDDDGKVYQNVDGLGKPDRYVGRVDVSDGKIYDANHTPERYAGRVEADGKVYQAEFGPDEYLGRVEEDGKCFHHKRLARDEYMGHIEQMDNIYLGGAAFLLLILPAWQKAQKKDE